MFLIHFSMGLWFLFVACYNSKKNKKQQHSTTFREMAVETETEDQRSLCHGMKKPVCFFSRAHPATISLCKGKCHHKKGQPRCVHPGDRMFSAGLSASKREITGGEEDSQWYAKWEGSKGQGSLWPWKSWVLVEQREGGSREHRMRNSFAVIYSGKNGAVILSYKLESYYF